MPTILTLENISGTFQVDETITGGTSGATGVVVSFSDPTLTVKNENGLFQENETITGGSSGATATITSIDRTVTQVTQTISPFPTTLPDRSQPDGFEQYVLETLNAIKTLTEELPPYTEQLNLSASDASVLSKYLEQLKNLAETAKTLAETARDKANKWATESEDVIVDDGINPQGYSAYHWMKKTYLWGNAPENTQLNIDGLTGYSAYHWAKKTARGDIFTATSNTTITIENNVIKDFTLNEPNRGFIIGSKVRISDIDNPTVNYMEGIVTSYTDDTLSVMITTTGGDGFTGSSWAISLSGVSFITESFSYLTYDNKDALRNIESNSYYYVQDLGVYKWYQGLALPDDGELCFQTVNGGWLLILPSFDITLSYTHAELDPPIENLQTDLSNFQSKFYYFEINNTIVTVATNSSVTQNVVDANIQATDSVFVSFDIDTPNLIVKAIAKDGSVDVILTNLTATDITVQATKWKILVYKGA